MRSDIRKITLSSIFSAIIVVLVLIGTVIDILDMTVAAICTLAVYIIQIEVKGKYPFLVYITSSILCIILVPLNTASLYFISFFGYYPILKQVMQKLPKFVRKLLCLLIFNIVMALLMILFKAIFALQNEPIVIYFALLAALNIFFICFDYVLDIFIIIYMKKFRNKIRFLK